MTSPFDAPPPPMPEPSILPVAVVVDDRAQFDAYVAAGAPGSRLVMVIEPGDVPEHLGGLAVVTERDLGDELRAALVAALRA